MILSCSVFASSTSLAIAFYCCSSSFLFIWSFSFFKASLLSFYHLSMISVLSYCSISLLSVYVSSCLKSLSIFSLAHRCSCSSRSERSSLRHSSLTFSTLASNSASSCFCFWFASCTASVFSSSTCASSCFWKLSLICAAWMATCSSSFYSYKLYRDYFDWS